MRDIFKVVFFLEICLLSQCPLGNESEKLTMNYESYELFGYQENELQKCFVGKCMKWNIKKQQIRNGFHYRFLGRVCLVKLTIIKVKINLPLWLSICAFIEQCLLELKDMLIKVVMLTIVLINLAYFVWYYLDLSFSHKHILFHV